MKRLKLILLLAIAAIAVSCNKEAGGIDESAFTGSIRLSSDIFEIGPDKTSMSVGVRTDIPVSVTTSGKWFEIDRDQLVPGPNFIGINVQSNPSPQQRSGEIVLSALDGSESVTVLIIQAGNENSTFIRPHTQQLDFDFREQTVELRVSSDFDFHIIIGDKWLTSESESCKAVYDTTLYFTADMNTASSERTTFIRLSADGVEKTVISVRQSAYTAELEISETEYAAEYEGGKISVSASCRTPYTVTSDAEWILFEQGGELTGDKTIEFTVEANPEIEERTGTVTFSSTEGEDIKTLVVVQAARPKRPTNDMLSFEFRKEDNPHLAGSYSMTIGEDNIISGRLEAIEDRTDALIATFTHNGDKVYIGTQEQTSGVTVNDFRKPVTYRVVSETGETKYFTVRVMRFTGLPILYIDLNSGGEVTSKEVWAPAKLRLEGNLDMDGLELQDIEIKGRGNSTWSTFLKKRSYNIRLGSRQKVLGMPKHKRWVLMANYRDKTLMRNAVAFHFSSLCEGIKWTPHYRQVELVLNGTFRGVYQLAEQIKIDKNRVNIQEMLSTDTDPERITGGYIIELDRGVDADQYGWVATYLKGSSHRINIKVPDTKDGNDTQFQYIRGYLDSLDSKLGTTQPGNFGPIYERYFDLPSMIDQWLVYELSGTPEPNGPNSYYMYKDRGDDKIYGGPVWDFDYRSYMTGTARSWVNRGALWMPYLLKDQTFVDAVKERWALLYPKLTSVFEFIDAEQEYMQYSEDENWAIHEQNLIDDNRRENGDEFIPWRNAVDRMREYLRIKIPWMNTQIKNMRVQQ